ncbi:MAG: 1-aminocyclopropane-1-carboxylate deaminase/D-cysteine desulfhydrase [Cyclobacteriaceae bacterium]
MLSHPKIIENTPLQEISLSLFQEKGVQVWVKRDDLTGKDIQGNKWRKLKYNLVEAKNQQKATLLTFGGAYSNHIHAVAGAGALFGFKTIGIIRGEEHLPLNKTLAYAQSRDMELHYLNRTKYREKNQVDFLKKICQQFDNPYIIPEGGTNEFALAGCTEMVEEIEIDFDYLCLPCGTAGTLAGAILGLKEHQKAIGFSVLKGKDFLEQEVEQLIGKKYTNWEINWNYHFGGYAKKKPELLDFMQHFHEQTEILLEPIYTGKLFFGVLDLIKKGYFEEGSKIVLVHTGGLQGIQG